MWQRIGSSLLTPELDIKRSRCIRWGWRETSEINIWKSLFRKINKYRHSLEFPLPGRRNKEESESVLISCP